LLSTQGRGRKIRMTSHPKRPRDPPVDTIFGFEKEACALEWIKEKSQGWLIERARSK
jgi:hypothetical protein